MKKWTAFGVRALIAISLGVLLGVGWLLVQDYMRTWGGYSFSYIYREDGILEKEICYKDGEFVRVTKQYSPEGVIEAEWLNNGNARMYSKDGKIQYEFLRNQNDPEKHTIKTYHENGRLADKLVYRGAKLLDKKGKPLNGVYRHYYQNGNVRREETYRDGRVNGPWREFYKTGDVKLDFVATEDNRHVSGKSYYDSGQVETIIEQRAAGPVMVKYDRAGNTVAEYEL